MCSAGIPTEDNEASEPGEAVGGDAGDAERAEKKWREYIRDQASPMADFFAGQVRFLDVNLKRVGPNMFQLRKKAF